jgi:hypothetical protein
MRERKNAAQMTSTEVDQFTSAIESLINDYDTWGDLAQIHSKMRSYTMHGMYMVAPGMKQARIIELAKAGKMRFLSWHRKFLLVLEQMIQDLLHVEIGIPYVRWADGQVPAWVDNYKPVIPRDQFQSYAPQFDGQIRRWNSARPGFFVDGGELATIMFHMDYEDFTGDLEDAHNRGHNWYGPVMAEIPIAPLDPIFWLHHSEVDRLWSIWQLSHPARGPEFDNWHDSQMTPWAVTADGLKSISSLGYSYEDGSAV